MRPGRAIDRGVGVRLGSDAGPHIPAPALAGFGIAFLLARILVVQGDLPVAQVLACGFGLLLIASIGDPGEPATRLARLQPAIALIVGCSAVSLAAAFEDHHPGSISIVAVALTCLAAIAEEAFFRRFLYERLCAFGAAVAILGSAAIFAAIHVPAYGLAAFPVDLGAGVLFGWQRWASGSWKVSAATHLLANLEVMFR